jgi:hypothetical protein
MLNFKNIKTMIIRSIKYILLAMVVAAIPISAHSEDDPSDGQYVVDVTPGFPPFDTVDDPHPAEFHTIEANIFAQGDRVSGGKNTIDAPYFDLNYGVIKNVQLKWEGWYVFQQDSQASGPNQTNGSGFGNNLVGVKWMFLDGDDSKLTGILHDVSAAVYPQMQFAPSSRAVNDGLADGGKIYILPLLVSKGFQIDGRPFAVTVNVGYNYGVGGQPDSVNEGIGVGGAISSRTSLMVSASMQQFHPDQSQLVKYELGVIHVPKRFKDFSIFSMVGTAKDDSDHFIWAIGFQKVIHTN